MDDQTRNLNQQDLSGLPSMAPVRAWEIVKSQLQTEMDKAAYAARVDQAVYISFEGSIFTIGTPDPYTRDWLESYLSSTIARKLTGLLERESEIRFITSSTPTERPASETLNEGMLVSIQRGLLEAFTKPDTALYFPGYWLRWIPYIGAKPFATILAFRQALYLEEARKNGHGEFKEDAYFAVSAEKVAEIIGVTAKTIRRQRDGYRTSSGKFVPPQLNWFLTVRKTNKVNFSSSTNQFAREAHQYAFKQSPITPGDIEAIVDWLLANGLDNDPVGALEKAVQAQPRELIQFPLPKPTRLQLNTKPGSARADLTANILSYCSQSLDAEERKQILSLSEKLRIRIMKSDGQVKVPLYFLKHILPAIGAPAAIMITYLRKRAYRNTATGEIREKVSLQDGISELATLLGVKPSAVYYHLPINQDPPSEEDNGQTNSRDGQIGKLIYSIKNESDRLEIHVSTSDHLIPEHQEEYDRAVDLAEALLKTATPEEIEVVFHQIREKQENGHSSSSDSKNVHIQDSNFVHIEDLNNVHMDDSKNVHIEGSKNVHIGLSRNVQIALADFFEKCPDLKYFKFLSIEILENIILELITNLNTLTTGSDFEPSKEKASQTITWTKGAAGEWDFSSLFKSCRIDQQKQVEILENHATPEAFVSQLIYAYSPEGASLNHPAKFALKQILRPGDGDLGHGPRHDRLAGLGPSGLQALLKATEIMDGYRLSVSEDLKGAQDWKQIMSSHRDKAPLLELGELLGLLKIDYV